AAGPHPLRAPRPRARRRRGRPLHLRAGTRPRRRGPPSPGEAHRSRHRPRRLGEPMPLDSALDAAAQLLTDRHRPETRNEYGRTIIGGFSVTEGPDGTVRVSHATAEPDLLDPDRPSDDDLAP